MEKKEYILDNEDVNHALLLAKVKEPVIQLKNGKYVYITPRQLADEFWYMASIKYQFIRETVEENLPNRDARYFLAVPMSKQDREDSLLDYCKLCKGVTGPAVHEGCDRHKEAGCSWYSGKR